MNHATRYEHLIELTEGKFLDSNYRAVFYLMAAIPEIYEAACKCVSCKGIDFCKINRLCNGKLDEPQKQILSIAGTFFSRNSKTDAAQDVMFNLRYPWLTIAMNAVLISMETVNIQIQETEEKEKELILKMKSDQTTKCIYARFDTLRDDITNENEDETIEM